MLASKRRKPGQQNIAPQVRRRCNLQHPAQRRIITAQALAPLLEGLQHRHRGGQVLLAFGRQAQAAGGARKQAHIKFALKALDRRRHLAWQ
ncbi:hypothetical protein D3C85_1275400 [compost metagenome]